MKKEYEVRIVVTDSYRVFVMAGDFEEAEELAKEMLDGGLPVMHSRTDIEAVRTDDEEED